MTDPIDGNEGVLAARQDLAPPPYPLMETNKKKLKKLYKTATRLEKELEIPFRIYKFTHKEDITKKIAEEMI